MRLLVGMLFCAVVFAQGAVAKTPQLVSSGPILESKSFVWTEEEMAKARPYPMTLLGTSKPGLPPEPEGLPGGEEGRLPGNRPLQQLKELAAPFVALPGTVNGYTYPFPFTRYANFVDYSVWPFSTIVKIFFRSGGSLYVCSGAVWPNRAILTAGHCVYDNENKRWHTDVQVVPQYKNGNAPLGTFRATELITFEEWQDGEFGYDMGLIITEKVGGQNISYFTGYLGALWNQSTNQSWTVIGYPAAKPFNGKTQQICHGSIAENDTTTTPAANGIGCDQTGGSSGGPWILRFTGARSGSGNRANGVVSYKYSNRPKAMYSPYFGSAAQQLWNKAKAKK